MEVNNRVDMEIRAALDSWFNAYSKQDADSLLSMVAPDDNVVFIGTESDEKKIGRDGLLEGLQRDFSQADSIAVSLPWVSICASGTVAWVAADYVYDVVSEGVKVEVSGRLTLVMEKRASQWLIVHAHFSSPVDGKGQASQTPH